MGLVLVVDDDPTILQVAKTILEHSGFTTLSASNGSEAIPLLAGQHVDVLLTDMTMPGMSGGELIAEARRLRPGLPVCCMTACMPLLSPELEQVLIIAKPFAPRELIHAVRQISKARLRRAGGSLANLQKRAKAARAAWLRAAHELDHGDSELPQLPHPDRSLRVQQLGRKRAASFQKYRDAFQQYREALKRSASPGDTAENSRFGKES